MLLLLHAVHNPRDLCCCPFASQEIGIGLAINIMFLLMYLAVWHIDV
jgi:hypothetical protein